VAITRRGAQDETRRGEIKCEGSNLRSPELRIRGQAEANEAGEKTGGMANGGDDDRYPDTVRLKAKLDETDWRPRGEVGNETTAYMAVLRAPKVAFKVLRSKSKSGSREAQETSRTEP
jgi:hypothetical protein